MLAEDEEAARIAAEEEEEEKAYKIFVSVLYERLLELLKTNLPNNINND